MIKNLFPKSGTTEQANEDEDDIDNQELMHFWNNSQIQNVTWQRKNMSISMSKHVTP